MLSCLLRLLCGLVWSRWSVQWCFAVAATIYLHWKLTKAKVEGRLVLASFLFQALFVFFFLGANSILPASLPTNPLFLLISVLLYKKFLDERLELRENFCFSSDLPKEWFEDVVSGPSFDGGPQDNVIRTSLKCLAVVKKQKHFIDGSLPVDLIGSVEELEGDSKLIRSLYRMDIDVSCCFKVCLEGRGKENGDFVLVAKDPEMKVKWVGVLKRWIGDTEEDVHTIWLKRILEQIKSEINKEENEKVDGERCNGGVEDLAEDENGKKSEKQQNGTKAEKEKITKKEDSCVNSSMEKDENSEVASEIDADRQIMNSCLQKRNLDKALNDTNIVSSLENKLENNIIPKAIEEEEVKNEWKKKIKTDKNKAQNGKLKGLLQRFENLLDEDENKKDGKVMKDCLENQKFSMRELVAVMDKCGRCTLPSYLLHAFENIDSTGVIANRRSLKLLQGLEDLSNMAANTLRGKKQASFDSKVMLPWASLVHLFKFLATPLAVKAAIDSIPGMRKRVQSLPTERFKRFLSEVQKEIITDDTLDLIQRHEPILKFSNLSIIGLTNFLMDEEEAIFNKQLQDSMDHPLSHYYIATSHNTYLTKDQVKSKSSVDMYVRALQRGCRCLELDCWDGSDSEPVIYHGFTLTSKIPFKETLEAIKKHAFETSPYPLILSIENHCCVEQQKVMAEHFKNIFGDMLYLEEIPEDECYLPSPNQLKGKILLKSKKIVDTVPEGTVFEKDSKDEITIENKTFEIENSNNENKAIYSDLLADVKKFEENLNDILRNVYFDGDASKSNSDTGDDNETNKTQSRPSSDSSNVGIIELSDSEDEDDDDMMEQELLRDLNQKDYDASDITSIASYIGQEGEEDSVTNEMIKENKKCKMVGLLDDFKKANQEKKKSKKKVLKLARELSDLVVYCQPKTFKSFLVAKENDKHYSMYSFGEKKATRLQREDMREFVTYNTKQLSRIYPAGYRIDSSNFNPTSFWNVGCQLVALNYQTACKEMQLNQGLFQRNNFCGYVLKPEFLRDKEKYNHDIYNPPRHQHKTLTIKVIGAHSLPYKFPSSVRTERSYCVQVRVFGAEANSEVQQTQMVKNNGLNPMWEDVLTFRVAVPDLALVMFSVCSKFFVAQYCLPYNCMRNGFRRVPLCNKHSEPVKESFLLVHIYHN